MNKAPVISAIVFLSCGLTGYWLTARAGATDEERAEPSIATVARPDKPKDAPAPSGVRAATAPAPPPDSELTSLMVMLRELESTPLKKFPALIEKELLTAADTTRLTKTVSVWMERDFDGYIAWLKTQPETRKLVEASRGNGNTHAAGMYWQAIAKLGAKDPEKAWQLIGKLPGGDDDHRWQVVGTILNANPEAAAAFVRNHRDTLGALRDSGGGFYGCDPVKAVPVLEALPPGEARKAAARQLSRHYSENPKNIAGAAAWFQSLPPDAREAVAASVQSNSLVGVSPEQMNRLREIWKVEGAK